MDKNGIASKLVCSNTEEGVTTQIRIHYNTHTDHITFGSVAFRKSPGWSNSSVTNKSCSDYLGITVAERVLSHIFKDVERMPYGNPGFDFKCRYGYLIDVKSACQRKNGGWTFRINHNAIADYFLCLAFDNRQDLNPLHIWLIPGRKINYLVSLTISITTIDKWSEYELTDKLDKIVGCCNVLRGEMCAKMHSRSGTYWDDDIYCETPDGIVTCDECRYRGDDS